MIVVAARLRIHDGCEADFIAASCGCIESTRSEAGNLSYELYRDAKDPSDYLFFEEWKSREDLDGHMQSAHYQRYRQETEAVVKTREIRIYEAQRM